MLEVAGSLWSVPAADQLDAARRLAGLGMPRLHWDASDGRFAAAGGFGAGRAHEVASATGLTGEAHVMAVRPLAAVDAWTEVCDLVVVHLESEDWSRAVDRVAARGAVPGVALSPGTPLSLVPTELPVLVMAITPGTAGSAFAPATLERVAALREAGPDRRVGVDGGVQRRHAEALAHAGADWAVVGTDLFTPGGGERWADVLVPGGPPRCS